MFRLASMTAFALCLGQAQDVTGDWLGTLSMEGKSRRLALHISKTDSGLKGTMDSVDEGVNGLPLDAVRFSDSKLIFNYKGQSTYTGKLDASGNVIAGEFESDAGAVAVTFRRGAVAKVVHKPAKPSDIDGDWTGTANTGVVIHIANTEDGLIAALDVPAQSVKGVEASSVQRKDSSLSIGWKVFGTQFEGKIADDRKSIAGAVSEGTKSIPMTLTRKP